MATRLIILLVVAVYTWIPTQAQVNPEDEDDGAYCACKVFGDPSFKSFDKNRFCFQQKGFHVLGSSTTVESDCQFEARIETKLWKSEVGLAGVVRTDIRMRDHKIVFYGYPNHKIEVDGNKVDLAAGASYVFDNRNMIISAVEYELDNRKYIEARFRDKTCDLKFNYNGRYTVLLSANRAKYARKLSGLCGDCDGVKTDDVPEGATTCNL